MARIRSSHYFLKKQRFKNQNRKKLHFPDSKHLVPLVYTIIMLHIMSILSSAVLQLIVLDIQGNAWSHLPLSIVFLYINFNWYIDPNTCQFVVTELLLSALAGVLSNYNTLHIFHVDKHHYSCPLFTQLFSHGAYLIFANS